MSTPINYPIIDDKSTRLAYQLSRSISYGKHWYVEERLAWEFPYLAARLRAVLPSTECPSNMLFLLATMLRDDRRLQEQCFVYCSYLTCGLSVVPFTEADIHCVMPEAIGRTRYIAPYVEVEGRDGIYRSLNHIRNASFASLVSDVRSLLETGTVPVPVSQEVVIKVSSTKTLYSALLSVIPVGEWQIMGGDLIVRMAKEYLSRLYVPYSFCSEAATGHRFMGQGELSCLIRFVRTEYRCSCLTFSDCRLLFGQRFSRLSAQMGANLDPDNFKQPDVPLFCSKNTFLPDDIHRLFSVKRFWSFAAVSDFIRSSSLCQYFIVDRDLDELAIKRARKTVQLNLYGPNGKVTRLCDVHNFILNSFGYFSYQDFCKEYPELARLSDLHRCTPMCDLHPLNDEITDAYICDDSSSLVSQMLQIRYQYLEEGSTLSDYNCPPSITVSYAPVDGFLLHEFLRIQRILRKRVFFSGRTYLRQVFRTRNSHRTSGVISQGYVFFRYDESILVYRVLDSDDVIFDILCGKKRNSPGLPGFMTVRSESEWCLVGQGHFTGINFIGKTLLSLLQTSFCRSRYDSEFLFPAFLSLFLSPSVLDIERQEMINGWCQAARS
jgi:hypothetical protein